MVHILAFDSKSVKVIFSDPSHTFVTENPIIYKVAKCFVENDCSHSKTAKTSAIDRALENS